MTTQGYKAIAVGILVIGGFLRGNAVCAQQDSNLQPLAPEAGSVLNSGQNQAVIDASKNASIGWAGPVAPLPSSKPSKWPLVAIMIGNALDSVSTEIALRQPGLRETNPLGQSMTRRMALKAVTNVAEVWLVRKIGKQHPTAAKWFGYSIGAVTAGIAARNYRIAGHR